MVVLRPFQHDMNEIEKQEQDVETDRKLIEVVLTIQREWIYDQLKDDDANIGEKEDISLNHTSSIHFKDTLIKSTIFEKMNQDGGRIEVEHEIVVL